MHGLDPKDYSGEGASRVPTDCDHSNVPGLIARGDANVAALVNAIQATAVWKADDNVAIVVTFDEGSSDVHEGCCGTDPASVANFGGGHIPTIVITNHGPRGVVDSTPYSHYSLLRTLEDAFAIKDYLGHAGDLGKGVVPMVKLFQTKTP